MCQRLFVQNNQVICIPMLVALGRNVINAVAGSTSVAIGEWESHIAAQVYNVVPKEVIISAKNVVTIYGDNFISSDMLCCMFGKSLETVPATFISKLHISCTIPTWLSGNSTVAVSNNCADFSVWSETLMLMKSTVDFLSLAPTSGVSSGGSKVTICGNAAKYPGLQLRFGSAIIEVYKLVHSSFMKFFAPPLQPGIHAVDIYWADAWVTSVAGFESIDFPLIQFVPPLVAIVGRQTTFAIQGTKLVESRMSCCFLDQCFRFVEQNSKMTCSSPSNLTGSVSLAIKFDQVIISDTFQVYFMKSVSINGIFPSSGSHRGGNWVSVYLPVPSSPFPLSCRFGYLFASVEIVSPTELRCMLPKSSPGLVHFDLTIESIEINTNEIFFQLITDSFVTDLAPSYGFLSTQSLTIFGGNFQHNSVVYVSGEIVSTYLVNSSSLVCTIGPLSLGNHEVAVEGVATLKYLP